MPQRELIDRYIDRAGRSPELLWYYTPMALPFSAHLKPKATIYDCMDELSAFKFAPPAMLELEAELLRRSDLVFTGGHFFPKPKNIVTAIFTHSRAASTTITSPRRERSPASPGTRRIFHIRALVFLASSTSG